MAKTRFTPGPWNEDEVLNGVIIGGHPHLVYPIATNVPTTDEYAGVGVAVCLIPYENDDEATRTEVEANAHLIASAPDLYAALEMFTRKYSSPDDIDAAYRAARAALAKARGE